MDRPLLFNAITVHSRYNIYSMTNLPDEEEWTWEENLEEANYLLGTIYLDGLLVERSLEKAIHFLREASRLREHRSAGYLLGILARHNGAAHFGLANSCLFNAGSWDELLTLAEAGNHEAQYEVATCFSDGLVLDDKEVVAVDNVRAFMWFKKAFENGNEDAVIRVADYVGAGIYCERNVAQAIELYESEIARGSSGAANNLGRLYRDEQDYKKAFENYGLSYALDQSDGLSLALCYYYGIGTEMNKGKALEKLLAVSENKLTSNADYEVDEANYLLGKMHLEGLGVAQSVEKARDFLLRANAENDHCSAWELLQIIGRG